MSSAAKDLITNKERIEKDDSLKSAVDKRLQERSGEVVDEIVDARVDAILQGRVTVLSVAINGLEKVEKKLGKLEKADTPPLYNNAGEQIHGPCFSEERTEELKKLRTQRNALREGIKKCAQKDTTEKDFDELRKVNKSE